MRSFSRLAHHIAGKSPQIVAAAVSLVVLSACDTAIFSPKSPILDTRWIVPSVSQNISVANLLPSGVGILPDSSGFTITVAGNTVTRVLSSDCAACSAANGLTLPKPAFIANASVGNNAPSNITSATLSSGALILKVTNGYTFDPLRPSASPAAAKGFAVITISNGSTVIGKDSLNGANVSLAANGGVLNDSIPLSGVISGSSPITVSLTLNSPAGDPILMDASRVLTVLATPAHLSVANANVNVVASTVNSTSNFDLTQVDSTISKHVLSGALLLTVSNPFNVSGTLTVSLTPCVPPSSGNGACVVGAPITKSLPLVAGSSSPSISFTKAELQKLFGSTVTLLFTGAVNSSGTINVSPKQAVVVSTHLDVSLEVGS